VLAVAGQYLREKKAPTSVRVSLCDKMYTDYKRKTLIDHGIVFSPLDIRLHPLFAKHWPSLSLDKLQAPNIGDAEGVASFIGRLIAGGTISPNQMLDMSEVLKVYQRQATVPGEYSSAWMELFCLMNMWSMQEYVRDIRRKCLSHMFVPLLTKEDEEELRAKIKAKRPSILLEFDATSPYSEAGAAAAAAEKARQNTIAASHAQTPSFSTDINEELAGAYREILSSHNYSELKDVNPRVLAQSVRSMKDSTSSQRHATLREAGKALIDSGNTVSAALLSAEYERVPAFLRTTSAINAFNSFFYPSDERH